jgi:hypothetical protein
MGRPVHLISFSDLLASDPVGVVGGGLGVAGSVAVVVVPSGGAAPKQLAREPVWRMSSRRSPPGTRPPRSWPNVPLVQYDRDCERIATVIAQEHIWFVSDGPLAEGRPNESSTLTAIA